MADVFVSYSRADRPRIRKLAEALGAAGFDVWWDGQIEGGSEFSKETEARLNEAKAVIVAWSQNSIESNWVADEATIGRDKKILVPISLDATPPKLGFRQFQTIDFAHWAGDLSAPEYVALLTAVAAKIGAEPPPVAPRTIPPWTDRLRKPPVLAAIAAGLIALVAAAIFLPSTVKPGEQTLIGQSAGAPDANTAPPARGGVGLAVLPFVSFGDDPDQVHFADGLTEELLNWLANVEGLNVPGRTTSFQFKGGGHDLREVGARLGVVYILEGSVRRSGEALRVTAQLIEVSSGFHVWSKTYDRNITDIFAIQDEIARLVTTELLGAIPGSGVENPGAVGDVDPKSHELYLEGRALWAARDANGAFWKFHAATQADPDHALAQAYLAVVASGEHNGLIISGLPPGTNRSEIAETALRKAVALRPQASDVHYAQGWMLESRHGFLLEPKDAAWREASDHYERAVRANPRNGEALYARMRFIADPAESTAYLRRIIEIDPGHARAVNLLADHYLSEGDPGAAKGAFDALFALAPGTPRIYAARTYQKFGDLEKSAEVLLRDFDGPGFSSVELLKRAAHLADLGAVKEAAFLYDRIVGPEDQSMFGAVQAALLRSDYRSSLPIAAEIHALSDPPVWSATLSAYSHLLLGENDAAYQVLFDHDPDVGAVVRLVGGVGVVDHAAFIAAIALARMERKDEAADIWKRALAATEAETGEDGWALHMARGIIHANLGDAAKAFAELDAAHEGGFRFLYSYRCNTCVDPAFFVRNGFFQPIFDDPRFAAYVGRIVKENAETLMRLDKKYAFLARIRADMPAE